MNKVSEARAFLEDRSPGAFARVIEFTLARGGVVHAAPDCFLAGVLCEDDARCLHVVFQCSHLPALRRVLLSLPQFLRVRWRRDFKGAYGVRERPIADFCRHRRFGVKTTEIAGSTEKPQITQILTQMDTDFDTNLSADEQNETE